VDAGEAVTVILPAHRGGRFPARLRAPRIAAVTLAVLGAGVSVRLLRRPGGHESLRTGAIPRHFASAPIVRRGPGLVSSQRRTEKSPQRGVGRRGTAHHHSLSGSWTCSVGSSRSRFLLCWSSNTMVCTKQFCSYRDRADDFAALDATVVGISSQDLDSHEGFMAKHGLNVPLLSDVDRQVSISYSAFSSRLGIKRAVIVIDEQGIVRARHDHLLGLDYQSVDELKAMLDALPAAA
jgi:thioredoxin-dependent peroxiredoxin